MCVCVVVAILLCRLLFFIGVLLSHSVDSSVLRVTDALGEGNFAVVYAGDYKGDKVAIKILRSVEATDDLWREAATMQYERTHTQAHAITFYGIPTHTQTKTHTCTHNRALSASLSRVTSARHPNVIHFYGICEVSAPVRASLVCVLVFCLCVADCFMHCVMFIYLFDTGARPCDHY